MSLCVQVQENGKVELEPVAEDDNEAEEVDLPKPADQMDEESKHMESK